METEMIWVVWALVLFWAAVAWFAVRALVGASRAAVEEGDRLAQEYYESQAPGPYLRLQLVFDESDYLGALMGEPTKGEADES